MILILGRYPSPVLVSEGSMSRVAAIDRVFEASERIYVSFSPKAEFHDGGTPVRHSDEVIEYTLNLDHLSHFSLLRRLMLQASLVYCTAITHGQFAIPFIRTGSVVVDMHGLAPEEERLEDRPGFAAYMEAAEAEVMIGCRKMVVVTEAMKRHFQQKYPESSVEMIVAPIFETAFQSIPEERALTPRSGNKVLYSGGLQAWQNVDLMLEAAEKLGDKCHFTFLTNQPEELEELARQRKIRNGLTIASVSKDDLVDHYLAAEYGLVLRDDIAVNRVACPTKLVEYLLAGVIPVVLSPRLGDFPALGYQYLTLDEFLAGRWPDEDKKQSMRKQNRACMEELHQQFKRGTEAIQRLAAADRLHDYGAEHFLTPFERQAIYPAWARVSFAGRADSQHTLSIEMPGPYQDLEFNVDSKEPYRSLTIQPIQHPCCLKLDAVEVFDKEGRSVPFELKGRFTKLACRGLTAFSRPIQLKLLLAHETQVGRLRLRFDFQLLGYEVRGIHPIREFCKRSRLFNQCYCSWIRPVLRKVSGASAVFTI